MIDIKTTDLGAVQLVELEPMSFLYMEVANDVESQQKAWPAFEARFPSLTGRKMFGLGYDHSNTYRVCSRVLEQDGGETFGLDAFEFEGGRYLRLRLRLDPPALYEKIGPAYGFLFGNHEAAIDWERPTIEHYKANNILDVMVPVKG